MGNITHSYKCLNASCHTARDYGAAKIRNEVEAARHHQRFPHHEIAIMETRVVAIFGEATAPLIEICVHCRNTLPACNASGCGGRRYPGWRDVEDVPPF